MKSSKLVLLSLVVLSLTGCASVLKGTEQVLTFTSDQDGAQVLLDGVSVGVTPLSMKVKKNSKSTVMVKKDGFRTQTMPLDKKYDGVTLLSILWWPHQSRQKSV